MRSSEHPVVTCSYPGVAVGQSLGMNISRDGYGCGTQRDHVWFGVITFVVELPAGLHSGRLARRFLDEKLSELGFVGDHSVVQLLASELVSNAVRHGRPPFHLTVEMVGGSATVRVTDHDCEHRPVRQPADPCSTCGGRGLLIVEELADEWGCDVADGEGKAVWFTAGPALR